jgi:hypothetical protein
MFLLGFVPKLIDYALTQLLQTLKTLPTLILCVTLCYSILHFFRTFLTRGLPNSSQTTPSQT